MPTWSDETRLAREHQRQNQIGDLAQRAVADRTGSGTVFGPGIGGAPPAPSSLALVSQVQGFKATWTPPEVRDIRRFDIDIADNITFQGTAAGTHGNGSYLERFEATGSSFYLPALTSGVTYYARIRTILSNNATSAWSALVTDNVSAQIITGDVLVGSVTEVVELGSADTTWATLNLDNETDESDILSVDGLTADSWVQIEAPTSFTYNSDYNSAGSDNRLTVTLERDDDGGGFSGSEVTVDTLQIDFHSTVPSAGAGSAANIANFIFASDNPGTAGDYDYRVVARIDIAASNTLIIDISSMQVRATILHV